MPPYIRFHFRTGDEAGEGEVCCWAYRHANAERRAPSDYHWTDSKIQVHAFYCVLALLLTSLLQRELAGKGEPLSINRMLEELGGIRETLVIYPRRQGQRPPPPASCPPRMTAMQQPPFSPPSLQRFV